MQGMLGRLTSYLDTIRAVLGNEPRTESFVTYCAGLLSCQPRKTAESIAASASITVKESTTFHQRLLYVIGQAVKWTPIFGPPPHLHFQPTST